MNSSFMMMTGELKKMEEVKRDLLLAYLNKLLEVNERINLTRITDFQEALVLHLEDSLSGLVELNQAPPGLYGDLGSGGGFPGVALAIASGRETVLIDTRKKKMTAVGGILEELGLNTQISTYSGRAELLARKEPCSFAVLTARALSRLSVLLELASPLLIDGGLLICYKADVEEDEIADARRVLPLVGMKVKGDRCFLLEGEFKRRIITFEKSGKPSLKLPRLEGQAQKNPL